MSIIELYEKLGNAIEAGLGNNDVMIYPDGFDEPISIEDTHILEAKDAEEYPYIEDYIGTFVLYV